MNLNQLFLAHFCKYIGDHAGSIVIFGAGEQTIGLVCMLADITGPEIVAIIDDRPSVDTISGIPVYTSAWKPDAAAVDAVVVSSASRENILAETARQWGGDDSIPIIRIYNDFLFLLSADISFYDWPLTAVDFKHDFVPPKKSYIICTYERTGSSVLSSMLQQSGLVGHPHEQFNSIMHGQAEKGNVDYVPFIKGFISRSASENGVSGTKMHWSFYEEFRKAMHRHDLYRDLDGAALIEKVMPNTSFIYLVRNDRIRQAISLWKSRRTGGWHAEGNKKPEYVNPKYSYRKIRRYMKKFDRQYRSWEAFFESCRIEPLVISYEDMIRDFGGTCIMVLQRVGADISENFCIEASSFDKLADDFTQQCYEKYCEDSQKPFYKKMLLKYFG